MPTKKPVKKAVKPAKKPVAKKPAAKKVAAPKAAPFKLTYSTMFNPPEEMHTKYDKALAQVKANFGKDYGMIIGGQERYSENKFEVTSPINSAFHLLGRLASTVLHATLILAVVCTLT